DVVRVIDADTGAETIVAGNGTHGYAGDDGPATSASLALHTFGVSSLTPGLAVDGAGNLYIADTFNNLVRKVDTAGTLTTFAGTGSCGYSDGGPTKDPKQAALNVPAGVALDSGGNLYIADQRNCIVRKVTAGSTPTIIIVAGTAPAGDFFPVPVCTSD